MFSTSCFDILHAHDGDRVFTEVFTQDIVLILFQDSWDYSCGYVRAISHELALNSTVVIHNPFVSYSWRTLIHDSNARREYLRPFYDRSVVYIPTIVLPLQRFGCIRDLNTKVTYILFRTIYFLRFGLHRPIVWYFAYDAIRFPEYRKFGRLRVYDRPDHVASADRRENASIQQSDRQLIGVSSLVVVNSRLSYRYVHRFSKNVLLAPWGADEHEPIYKTQDEDMLEATCPHPRFGVVGSIDHRLDFRLIYKMARQCPRWNIILVGRIHEFSPRQGVMYAFYENLFRILALPNVYYVPEVSHGRIYSLLRSLDVGLVLYDPSQRFVCGSNPIKVYEYIAAGIPVVSTDIEMIRIMKPLVWVGKTTHEYLRCARAALKQRRTRQTPIPTAFLKRNSWRNHVKIIRLYMEKNIMRV